MTLKRGFKANAEREAKRVRDELGLATTAGLDPHALATHLEIPVVSAETLVDIEVLAELENLQTFAFSAATFLVRDRKIIVENPLRTQGRRNSDIAHELAHIMLGHELSEVRELNGMPFRTCMPAEEEEATAFGGTLLLPRPLLLAAARRGASPEEIAQEFDVTEDMARFRFNLTGVARQVAQARR
ncbi:MAG: ImmA/IrrE family metallo-endopeptidase [Solirubrobacterales bacterium]